MVAVENVVPVLDCGGEEIKILVGIFIDVGFWHGDGVFVGDVFVFIN